MSVSQTQQGPEVAAHYDAVPYHGKTFSVTSISRLAGVAQFAGLVPPPIEGARVLEIGCGDGGNLLALATAFPAAHFVGFDASFGQIAKAQEIMLGARVENAELHCRDVSTPPADLGTFDYIIAHGVFSWISPAARTGLLETVRTCLAPGGIAYVSYNCYPGWHTLDGLRHLLLDHSAGISDGPEKIIAVRNLMRLLEQGIEAGAMPSMASYLPALKSAKSDPDWYLFHDLISKHNQPCYFKQFMERAHDHDLKFVGEADFFQMAKGRLPAAVRAQLPADIDPVALGQSIDHFTNAKFRRTLLTHSDTAVGEAGGGDHIERLHLRSRLAPALGVPVGKELLASERIMFEDAFKFFANGPVEIATLSVAASYDRLPISVAELQRKVVSLLAEHGVQGVQEDAVRGDVKSLAGRLVGLGGFIPYTEGVQVAAEIGDRPQISSLSLYQAKNEYPWVSSMVPHSVTTDNISRFILSRMDGALSVDQITDCLAQEISVGRLSASSEGKTPLESAHNTVQRLLEHAIESGLLLP